MTRAITLAELPDSAVLTVNSSNSRIGIGSTQPTVKLDVTGDGNVSGTLTATSFSGDGTGLTGVASTDNIITGTAATFTGGINANSINVTGLSTFVGFVAFTTSISVGGTVTYEDVTNIDSVGVVTARSGIRIGAGQSVGSDGAAAVFYGDGSNLTGVISGVELQFSGASVGAAVTNINFSGVSSVTAPVAGLSTITIEGWNQFDTWLYGGG